MHTIIFKLSQFLFLAIFVVHCDAQEVRSFKPLINEENAIQPPVVEGNWLIDLSTSDTLVIAKGGDNFYCVKIGNSKLTYEAMFGKIDDILIMQLLPVRKPGEDGDDFQSNFIPLYSFYKVELRDDSLDIFGISYKWIFDQISKKIFSAEYEWSGPSLVLRMKSDQLLQFFTANKNQLHFFSDKITAARIGETRIGLLSAKKPDKIIRNTLHQFSQTGCTPNFPLKDGWFGGDGNVSVAISNTITLWLFSDSFVGGKEQASRPGSSIVANTVGVMTCGNHQPATMEYYWNDKHTTQPKPVFQTYTSRYKYWVTDAVMIDSLLYVILEKIGSRFEPPAPDEPFNFEHFGWTIATVRNPYAPPGQWKIDYSPITGIKNKQWTGQVVIEKEFAYMFFRENDSFSTITRFPVAMMRTPMSGIEYYSNKNIWVPGTGSDDKAILFKGEDSQTVEYHPVLKQWIMVIGPGFLNNKIRIRRSPRLTGPWSGEEVIYECPEQTPGSVSYHKDNFCYLGREHLQYFNPKTLTITLTYDYNTTNFQKLVSDTNVYTPKVISIKLKKPRE